MCVTNVIDMLSAKKHFQWIRQTRCTKPAPQKTWLLFSICSAPGINFEKLKFVSLQTAFCVCGFEKRNSL